MAKLNLENIGNTGDYEPKLMFVVSQGLVTAGPDIAAVKVYTMLEYGKSHYDCRYTNYKNFIRNQLKKGKIKRKNGLGFAIFSEGILNVTMFGGEYAPLVNPNVYGFSQEEFKTGTGFIRQDSEDDTYCVWEASDILSFEADSYKKNVLYTKGSVEGKRRFLSERFSGLTSDFPYCPEEQKHKVDLSHLGFDKRAVNSFRRFGIWTLGDLLKLSEEEILGRNRGVKTQKAVLSRLSELGYNLRRTK